jgi:adenine-specific DNA-methyltransferase
MPTLDWIGKKAVVNHHREVPYRLLHCDKGHSAGDVDAGNLLVQGDNLLALKALLPYYAGKVKCIYIDPPYNTGNENWVYNDAVNSPEILQWLGRTVGKEAEDLSRHDKWLCMMYPRLALLKEFLSKDGVLMMSIDDNEGAFAKALLNEIVGPQNFIAQLVWEKGRKNDAKLFSVGHEYILVYARSRAELGTTMWRAPKDGVPEIAAEYHRLRKVHTEDYDAISKGLAAFYKRLPKGHAAKKYSRAKNADKRGVWRDNNITWPGGGGPTYPILHPRTGKPCKVPEDGWRFIEESMKQKIEDDWVVFREDHKRPPFLKSYIYMIDDSETDEEINEGKKEVLGSVFYRHSQPSLDVMKAIFGEKIFPNPKDHEILARLIRYVTNNEHDCLILDSFAGSGTTGHSVLALNKADGGNRRFILAEMDETICRDVTAQRLTRVIDGYSDVAGLGGGYRFCTLGDPLFDELGQIREGVKFPDLAAHIFFTETGTPIPQRSTGKTPLLGVHDGRAVYLLFNGVLGDKRPNGGNVLTGDVLRRLPAHDGPKIIYGESCRLGADRLRREGVVFKQVPYEIKVS